MILQTPFSFSEGGGQLQREVCSTELLMPYKMTVGNKWQQYASAEMQEGACDECISGKYGFSKSMMGLLLRHNRIYYFTKHDQTSINLSVLERPPTKLIQHV